MPADQQRRSGADLRIRSWQPGYFVVVRCRLDQIVIDCQHPAALVRFWAAPIGGEPIDQARGWSHVEAPGFPKLSFQPVPESKSTKNRLHLDVEVDAGQIPEAVRVAVDFGATPVVVFITDEKGSFQVMLDPEGNEFCFVSD
ncbi:MAG: hypothetical protein QOI36_3042 [Pseudonocardiales bacterium]|nr:hypothetical protein [Pseudonocardiales bacterium]